MGTAARIVSFPAVATPAARILILGSMPGAASLQANEYYAHPRNAFWPIMRELLGFSITASYPERLHALQTGGIALWDVLQSCRRMGSLDSDIELDSMAVNDFAAFFAGHAGITLVCFNGATAERCYHRHVEPRVESRGLQYVRLPSTSPAHAALTLVDKVTAWRSAMTPHLHTLSLQRRGRRHDSGAAQASIVSPIK